MATRFKRNRRDISNDIKMVSDYGRLLSEFISLSNSFNRVASGLLDFESKARRGSGYNLLYTIKFKAFCSMVFAISGMSKTAGRIQGEVKRFLDLLNEELESLDE